MDEIYKPKEEKLNELPPIEVPATALSEMALEGVISNFIVREGTDYGTVEVSYSTKVEQIKKQIAKGDIIISFDPNTETVSLFTRQQWKKICR